MNGATCMSISKRVGHSRDYPDRFLPSRRMRPQPLLETDSAQQFGDNVKLAVMNPDIEDADDPRMTELSHVPRFAQQTLLRASLGLEAGNLNRDLPIELRVVPNVNF